MIPVYCGLFAHKLGFTFLLFSQVELKTPSASMVPPTAIATAKIINAIAQVFIFFVFFAIYFTEKKFKLIYNHGIKGPKYEV